jgi:hypothetical protein
MSERRAKRAECWVQQLVRDLTLGGMALRVGTLLAVHLALRPDQPWPTQAALAAKLQASLDAVQGATRQLVERGHLAYEPKTLAEYEAAMRTKLN